MMGKVFNETWALRMSDERSTVPLRLNRVGELSGGKVTLFRLRILTVRNVSNWSIQKMDHLLA